MELSGKFCLWKLYIFFWGSRPGTLKIKGVVRVKKYPGVTTHSMFQIFSIVDTNFLAHFSYPLKMLYMGLCPGKPCKNCVQGWTLRKKGVVERSSTMHPMCDSTKYLERIKSEGSLELMHQCTLYVIPYKLSTFFWNKIYFFEIIRTSLGTKKVNLFN